MVGAMGDSAAGVGQQCGPHATLLHCYDVDFYCYYGDNVYIKHQSIMPAH